jgi:hypothetical protein
LNVNQFDTSTARKSSAGPCPALQQEAREEKLSSGNWHSGRRPCDNEPWNMNNGETCRSSAVKMQHISWILLQLAGKSCSVQTPFYIWFRTTVQWWRLIVILTGNLTVNSSRLGPRPLYLIVRIFLGRGKQRMMTVLSDGWGLLLPIGIKIKGSNNYWGLHSILSVNIC